MAEEAAEAQRAAAAAPPSARWTELVQCEERQEAARRCGQAVETLLRAAPSAVVSAATEQQGDRLLAAMGKGLQQLEMFGDEALLVYVRRKFSERALLLFTALREAARAPDVAAALRRLELCVSVGAGPCPCLFGYALAEELVLRPGRAGAAGPPRARLEAWDYAASAWEPWVRLVDDQLLGGGRLSLRACDVAEALERQAAALDEPMGRAGLYLISYVLTETRGRWEGFVAALFERAAPGALFLCAEPTDWQLKRLVEVLRPERLATSPMWLDVRTTAAPPSVVLLTKARADAAAGGGVSDRKRSRET